MCYFISEHRFPLFKKRLKPALLNCSQLDFDHMKSWQNSAAITQDRGSFELERKYHVTYYQVVGKDLMRECILNQPIGPLLYYGLVLC